jgi:hypothetical protein
MRPPSDVSARDLFLKLTERPAPSVLMPFPRTGDDGDPVFDVRVFVLPQEAHDRARMAAHESLAARGVKEVPGLTTLAEIQDDAVARELVYLSVHEPDPVPDSDPPKYRRLFRSAKQVGELCTSDEVHALFTAYLLAQRQFGPYEASFQDEDEVSAWVKRLEEGGRSLPLLSQLASHQRDALLLSLAQRAYTLSLILECPSAELQTHLESIPQAWACGTCSRTGPVAESILSLDDVEPLSDALFNARSSI